MTRPLYGAVLVLLAGLVGYYLLRDAAAIVWQAPLDPNEGWNAYLTQGAMTGRGLYPPPAAFMVNNYPPLSFYLVGAVARFTGDLVVAGRLVAFAAFLLAAGMVFALARRMGCAPGAAMFATLFFAAALLIASDYVGMDDPQMLGHAVQLGGLWLFWRGRVATAALVFTVSLFVKHNLLALPLACALLAWSEDRGAARRFMLTGIVTGLAGLLLFRFAFGRGLLPLLASPRGRSLANMGVILGNFLAWSCIALGLAPLLLRRPERGERFTLVYLVVALTFGVAFSSGDGVDNNIFFDAAIALALAAGLVLRHWPRARPALALAMAAPLFLYAACAWSDAGLAYAPAFRREARDDIAFLRTHPGPAMCEMLSLCYWAGKPAAVDVFNIGEAFKTGARGEASLAGTIAARRFAVIQIAQKPFALGPDVEAALLRAYRLDHADDNGGFFVPAR